jgi:hypothetical protein
LKAWILPVGKSLLSLVSGRASAKDRGGDGRIESPA